MRYLHRARFVQKSLARRIVAIGHAAKEPDRDRVTERAMDTSMHRTA
jgi:hypothetical protein